MIQAPIIPLHQVREQDLEKVGGKALSLAMMAQSGKFRVPRALCVTTDAYNTFVSSRGIRERILLEINRKPIHQMRWEEVWDASLRIRNIFLKAPLPAPLQHDLTKILEQHFAGKALVVRSSAPAEDSSRASFAGIHESFVNVRGIPNLLEHIKRVWASLWSDAAILYGHELGLDPGKSAMAVVVQEIVPGERSGVAFTQGPTTPGEGVIEAVHGLNQGLVDGQVSPDRWIMDRDTGKILNHTAPQRDHHMVPGDEGVSMEPLPARLKQKPPLSNAEVTQVFDLAMSAEGFQGNPRDVEWTFSGKKLYTLQSRPVTTQIKQEATDDRRMWDLSLKRSHENLKILRHDIETRHIPEMQQAARTLAKKILETLTDPQLAKEVASRQEIFKKWKGIYWEEFIPFAHGIRLFGQVYNDSLKPEDPYQFIRLLQSTPLESVERNRKLLQMASMLRKNPSDRDALKENRFESLSRELKERFQAFTNRYGNLESGSVYGREPDPGKTMLRNTLLEMAKNPASQEKKTDLETLSQDYLNHFGGGEAREKARELLELGRVSYQLRDDDNIYLGRIEDELNRAAGEGIRRLCGRGMPGCSLLTSEDVVKALINPSHIPVKSQTPEEKKPPGDFDVKSRQLVGQPAGPGLARGPARVIHTPADLAAFKRGEILVCDAVDPTMTFVIPLAAAVVERRGGMLIHGAIIAREYGLPCVTGIPDLIRRISTGDIITVDGYLGITTCQ